MRKTHAVVQVAAALMRDPSKRHWGYDTSKASGVRPGAMYPILSRMLDSGWLKDGWEESAAGRKRPPRRYYEITDTGREHLRALLDQARGDARFAGLDLGREN